MSFVRDHYEGYDAPRLVLRLLRDSGGTPYLLLHGPEPDNRWEAFARAVREVVDALEQQYDAFERAEGSESLLASDEPLPTGEEIGLQFEQFLAGLDAQEGNDPNESEWDT